MNPRRIRLQMKELGLSISKLAEKSNLSESTVKRALSGERMSDVTAGMLAKALNADLNWLREDDLPGSEPVLNLVHLPDEPIEPIHAPTEPVHEPTEPTNEPTEPTKSKEKDEMIASLQCIIESYKERVIEQNETHKAEIKRLTEEHTERVNALTKDKIALAIATGVLMLFVISLFAFDILSPSKGWFQY